ncbi:head-tail joining protein [Komagataeibacter oboediens]|uniref:head-tail joining protein n=1 Tax=Komagataeibacter oboediens TaxID=65958 RepID=UPI000237DDAA|nr:hypothetical protein [Komagataeibacter oboediens]
MSIDFDALALGPCMDTFGEDIVYQPAAGGSYTITGIPDVPYKPAFADQIDGLTPTNIISDDAVVGIQLSQLPVTPLQGDLLTMRGILYRVREPQPDGRGGMLLTLNNAEHENDPIPGDTA